MHFRSFKEGTDKDKTVTNLAELPRIRRRSEQGIGACLEPEGNVGVGRNAGQVRGKADDGVGTTYASSRTRMPQVLEPPSFSGSPKHYHGTVAVALETAAKLCIATSFARRDETAQVRMLAHRSGLSA